MNWYMNIIFCLIMDYSVVLKAELKIHNLPCDVESVIDGHPNWGEYPHGETLMVHALR